MNYDSESMGVELCDFDPAKLILSEKKTKSWAWMQDGKMNKGSREYAEVYYERPGKKLVLILNDLKTPMGIQISTRYGSGFMSCKLTPEQSTEISQKIDDAIFNGVFEKRLEFMKGKGSKIQHPSEMKMMFQGLVKEGDDKPDGSGRWPDQITCTVPTKKKGQQVIVDENFCAIEDLKSKPYSWMALDGQNIKEWGIEVTEIKLDKEISVKGKVRLIVPNTETVPRVMTKRKLSMRTDTSVSPAAEPVAVTDSFAQEQTKVLEPPTKKSRVLPSAAAE